MSKQTVFIAGATGYTGRAVVGACVERGFATVAHVRPDSPQLLHWQEHFGRHGAEVDSTPWDKDALAARLRALAPTAIFSLLGITQAGARRRAKANGVRDTYDSVDYGLTVKLCDAAKACEKPPVFIYLSALGVREGAPGAYLQARWRTEKYLEASGLPFIAARPSIISGADRGESRPLERLAAHIMGGTVGLLGTLGAKRVAAQWKPIDNTSLARALVTVLERELTQRHAAPRVVEAAELQALAEQPIVRP